MQEQPPASMNGNGTNNFILCENDELNINTNNDFTFPDNVGPIGGFSYLPGLAYLVYSCLQLQVYFLDLTLVLKV
jgi:hypothetical protein